MRAYSVAVFTLASFTLMILIVFPGPSMAEHLNNTIQRVTADLARVSFLVLLLFGGLIGWRPEVRFSGTAWHREAGTHRRIAVVFSPPPRPARRNSRSRDSRVGCGFFSRYVRTIFRYQSSRRLTHSSVAASVLKLEKRYALPNKWLERLG